MAGMTDHTRSRSAVVVTALSLETRAVCEHLADLERHHGPQGTVFEVGRFAVRSGPSWRVAVVESGPGNNTAVLHTERAIREFQPSHAFFVGVAGALKDAVIGDVVVATKIYGYETGKAEDEFRPRPEVGHSSYAMEQIARAVARSDDWRARIRQGPPGWSSAARSPSVFVGPIAAGEKVVASVSIPLYRFLREHFSDALAVEMEAIGFAAALRANNGVESLVVRGISDAVAGKSEADAVGSQPAAARHAAAFAFEVLAGIPAAPEGVRGGGNADQADPWADFHEAASALYPQGPLQRDVWERAGGDPSQLRLTGRARDDWYSALRDLQRGGGGPSITGRSLLAEMRRDYPRNEFLTRLDVSQAY